MGQQGSTVATKARVTSTSNGMSASSGGRLVRLFLAGDVMLARGIDMIQKFSCDPVLYENNGLNAHGYVKLAESENGKIPDAAKRGPGYVWGEALNVLERVRPDVRIINLETSVTTCNEPWPRKGIHYRMHPSNLDVIRAANIDCCVLANNHTADWGMDGLLETLNSLKLAGLQYAGAGHNLQEAQAPAVFPLDGGGRVLVFAAGHDSSGIPERWRASNESGVHLIQVEKQVVTVEALAQLITRHRRQGDLVVLSIHWGGNWGYQIEQGFRQFAHSAIEDAGVDLIHGHSSHHPQGLEVYQGKLIIYGCGDFINDYEGIGGHREFRGDLSFMYLPTLDAGTGRLVSLHLVPMQMYQLSLRQPKSLDIHWLKKTMSRECKLLGCDVGLEDNQLHLLF